MVAVEKKPKYELITYDGYNQKYKGKQVRQYPDGSIRDERGYMVEPLPGKYTITQADASDLARKRLEIKQQVMVEAANQAVLRNDFKLAYNDMAYVAAITANIMDKATTLDDPKAIDAARFIFQETGIAASQAQNSAENDENTSVLAALGAAMVKHITRQAQDNE